MHTPTDFTSPNATRPPRRWFRFSLRTLMLAMLVLCCGLALGPDLVFRFSGFFASCGFVVLVVYAMQAMDSVAARSNFSFTIIFVPAIYCILATIFFLFGEAIDQPHPAYVTGNWVTVALDNFLPCLPFVGIAAAIVVALDSIVQQSRPRDLSYYPRFSNLRTNLTRFEFRLPLVIGLMLIFGYYAFTVVDVLRAELYHGLVWPPKRVFVTCVLLWEILWVVDCSSRPKQGTIVAAIGLLCLSFFFVLPLGFDVIRE